MAVDNKTRRIAKYVASTTLFLIVLTLSGLVFAQEPGKQPTPPPIAPSQIQTPPATEQEQSTATERPLYGLQGVLVETLDSRQVASQSADDQFNPASTIKLATALVALQTLGPDHRFATGIWTEGTFDKATGRIEGNVYISGRDPSFHFEHAISIARELNKLGIKEVSGDLIVAPGFTMNFSSSSQRSGEQLYDTLDSTLRNAAAIRAWNYERTLLKDQSSLEPLPSVAVMGGVAVGPVSAAAKLLLTHRSSKLVDILKVLLCYSNNFMAERIGDSLGGPQSVRQQLISQFKLGPTEIRLSSLSGLGVNRVSPTSDDEDLPVAS